MKASYCGQHDCYDCYHLVEFKEDVFVCVLHKIRVVPIDGTCCQYWRWEEDGPDDLHANNAMERMQQKDAADLLHKE